jgi:hypothetical protein
MRQSEGRVDEGLMLALGKDDILLFKEWWNKAFVKFRESPSLVMASKLIKVGSSIDTLEVPLLRQIFDNKAYKCFGELIRLESYEVMSAEVMQRMVLLSLEDEKMRSLTLVDYVFGVDYIFEHDSAKFEEMVTWVEYAVDFWKRLLNDSRLGRSQDVTDERLVRNVVMLINRSKCKNSEVVVALHAVGVVSLHESLLIIESVRENRVNGFNSGALAADMMDRIENNILKGIYESKPLISRVLAL